MVEACDEFNKFLESLHATEESRSTMEEPVAYMTNMDEIDFFHNLTTKHVLWLKTTQYPHKFIQNREKKKWNHA